MTTIAYYKDVLYTDTRHLSSKNTPVPSLLEDKVGKAILLKNGDDLIGYLACSPTNPTASELDSITKCLLEPEPLKSLKAYVTGAEETKRLSFGWTIIVTKTEVLTISSGNQGNTFNTREFETCENINWPVAFGSSPRLAIGYLVSGADPKKLMGFVSQHDDMTSPDTWSYHRKYLKKIKRTPSINKQD